MVTRFFLTLAVLSTITLTSGAVAEAQNTLPNKHGQVWREYDISAYTSRVTDSAKPQQAIIDWILRETGTEVWFNEPLGILSADKTKLRVYHTPRMQKLVADIVQRFVESKAEAESFKLRLLTVQNPNWRTKVLARMRPVNVQTPGIQAWLLSKEDAALLVSELGKRTDCREHCALNLVVHNGQDSTVAMRHPKNYIQSIAIRPGTWPGYQAVQGQISEGYTLQFDPLLSLDKKSVDAVVKCNVDQLERFVPVMVDASTRLVPNQQVPIQVPQIASWQLHERFRWPTDQVLLISPGVAATPRGGQPTAAIRLPFTGGNHALRADALIMVEYVGQANKALTPATITPRIGVRDHRGRY